MHFDLDGIDYKGGGIYKLALISSRRPMAWRDGFVYKY